MNTKEKTVTFRVNMELYNFIKEFSKDNRVNVSDMVRNILVYFYMGYLIGDFKQSMPELRDKFLTYVDTHKILQNNLNLEDKRGL